MTAHAETGVRLGAAGLSAGEAADRHRALLDAG